MKGDIESPSLLQFYPPQCHSMPVAMVIVEWNLRGMLTTNPNPNEINPVWVGGQQGVFVDISNTIDDCFPLGFIFFITNHIGFFECF